MNFDTDENMVYVVIDIDDDGRILAIYDANHSEQAYELADEMNASLKIIALNERLDEGMSSAFVNEVSNG